MWIFLLLCIEFNVDKLGIKSMGLIARRSNMCVFITLSLVFQSA